MLAYDIVLYDGTFVTASATSHSDLYWALRGGGSGFGVITSLETAVIGVPEESSGGFTVLNNNYKQTENEAREFFKRFQDFLVPDLPFGSKKYKEKIRATSAKYGGGASYSTNSGMLGFFGLFLGSLAEANSIFEEAGLRDPEIFNVNASFAFEFSSYADAQLFSVCQTLSGNPFFAVTWIFPSFDNGTGTSDMCEDLGIDSVYCHERNVWEIWEDFSTNMTGWPIKLLNCNPNHSSFNLTDVKDAILPALKDVAIKPQSWFNRPGAKYIAEFKPRTFLNKMAGMSWFGGILVGTLDPDVLLELAEVGVSVYHFAHGKCSCQ